MVKLGGQDRDEKVTTTDAMNFSLGVFAFEMLSVFSPHEKVQAGGWL